MVHDVNNPSFHALCKVPRLNILTFHPLNNLAFQNSLSFRYFGMVMKKEHITFLVHGTLFVVVKLFIVGILLLQ
jgi:hypothetical protein